MPLTNFHPLQNGFHFKNDFTNVVGLITTRGLCGGMAYSALDYFFSNIAVPVRALPREGTGLRDYIFMRQLHSLQSQGPTFTRLLVPIVNTDESLFSWSIREQDELGRLKGFINAGKPVPLGLISTRADLFAHHQVVAIGYDQGATVGDLRVHIYDPNHPNVTVTMIAVPRANHFRTILSDGRNLEETWRMYFVDYGFEYTLPPRFSQAGVRQENWRWCNKCQGLAFAGNTPGACPAGGHHDHTGSGNYVLVADVPTEYGQENWRWCNKCQGLAFAGNTPGRCPAGGLHDHAGSGNYVLPHDPPGEGQENWRWCNKCQGLAFAGNTPGRCPAGGLHDHAGSGNYVLAFV